MKYNLLQLYISNVKKKSIFWYNILMNIYDIAKLSGVSKSTVSRVINNDQKVSEKMREKVLSVMKENNFVPNKNARSILKTKRKNIVVIVTRLDSYSENRVIRGIMSKCGDEVEMMIFESQFDINKTKNICEMHNDADAYIIFAIGNEKYEFLDNLITPIILVGQSIENKICITFENEKAMKLLFNKVKPKNKMLYFALPDIDPTTGFQRTNAIKKLCQKNNITLDILLVEYSVDSKYIIPLIKNIELYDTILCATDSIALYVYMMMKKYGYSPKIGSVGNNVSINQYMDNYTSISLGYKQAGIEIASMLIKNEYESRKIKSR